MPLVETGRVSDETRLDTRTHFHAAKLLQTDINAWRDCTYEQCRKRQSCLGGPRGTSRRTGGWPACTHEGRERMREQKGKWKRKPTYDNETQKERAMRRMETDMRELDLILRTQEYNSQETQG